MQDRFCKGNVVSGFKSLHRRSGAQSPGKKRILKMIPRITGRPQTKWQLKAALFGLALFSSVALFSFKVSDNGRHRRLPDGALEVGERVRFTNTQWAGKFGLLGKDYNKWFEIVQVKEGPKGRMIILKGRKGTSFRGPRIEGGDDRGGKKIPIPESALALIDPPSTKRSRSPTPTGSSSNAPGKLIKHGTACFKYPKGDWAKAFKLQPGEELKGFEVMELTNGVAKLKRVAPTMSLEIPEDQLIEESYAKKVREIEAEIAMRKVKTQLPTQTTVAKGFQKIVLTRDERRKVNEFKEKLMVGNTIWKTNKKRYLFVGEGLERNGNGCTTTDLADRVWTARKLVLPPQTEVQGVLNVAKMVDSYYNSHENQVFMKIRCRPLTHGVREGWIIAADVKRDNDKFVIDKHIDFAREGQAGSVLRAFQVARS